LAGALAWRLERKPDAEIHYTEAARLESTNEVSALNLLTIRLSSTNHSTAEAARLGIERQITNSNLRATAVRQLIVYEQINKSWLKALEYSRELVTNPAANDEDNLNHLDLLHKTADPQFDSWLLLLKEAATNSPARAFALGKRLEKLDHPTNVLAWAQSLPEEIQSSPPVPQIAADCYVALKDWSGLLEAIEGQNWADAEVSRLALVALARRSLGQEGASQSAWHEALEDAEHRLDGLSSLARLATAWGWEPERKEVLAQISKQFPNERKRIDGVGVVE
jgi:lipopolysaccharide biosynthesis regulator YciM